MTTDTTALLKLAASMAADRIEALLDPALGFLAVPDNSITVQESRKDLALIREALAAAAPCKRCGGHGMIGWHTGQTPEQFEQHEAPCPDCNEAGATPGQGADAGVNGLWRGDRTAHAGRFTWTTTLLAEWVKWSHVQQAAFAQALAATPAAVFDGWEANANYLLNNCPHTIRMREGGGPESLLDSLIVTFKKMEHLLAKLTPAAGEKK